MDFIKICIVCCLFCAFGSNMSNAQLPEYKVTTILEKPLVMYVDPKQPHKGFKGLVPDLLKKIGDEINATFAIDHVRDGRYGYLDYNTGVWTGMIGELVNKTADIAAAGITITPERSKVVHFTQPYMDTGLSIVLKVPTAANTWRKIQGMFSFFLPFSASVWVVVFVSYIFVSVLYGVILQFDPAEEEGVESLFKNIRSGFPVIFYRMCFQGGLVRTSCSSHAAKILLSFWCLFIILLFATYITALEILYEKGDIFNLVSPISSFEELSKQTDMKYGTVEQGQTFRYFQNAKDEVDKSIGQYLTANVDNLVKSKAEGIELVRKSNGKYAFLMEEMAARREAGSPPCDLMLVHHSSIKRSYGFACSANEICRNLNVGLLRLQERGEIQELKDSWFKSQCDTKYTDNYKSYVSSYESQKSESGVFFADADSLTLNHVGSVFVLLGIGIVLSIAALVLEIFFATRIKKKMNSGNDNRPFEAITNDMN